MAHRIVKALLDSLNRQVLSELDLACAIDHPGENGRAREETLRRFLEQLLPQDYGVSTGFVVDAVGGISRQIDIVVYRKTYHPVFVIGGIQHFMVESVVAVFENKASIATTAALHQALENIASVKRLDRTNGGANYLLAPGNPPLDPNNFQHQVFAAILTEKSLARDTLQQNLLSYLRSVSDRRVWPNLYVDVRRLLAFFLAETSPPKSTVVPSEARFLSLTTEDAISPLSALAFELVNFLRVAPVVDFKPTSYFEPAVGPSQWVAI